jgi:acylphosphatase
MQELFLKVYGKVHGVCFRMQTQALAQNLDLTGWVKNVNDGTVEILAQGSEANLQKLEQWAGQGSELAQVEKVEADYHDVVKKFDSFDISY